MIAAAVGYTIDKIAVHLDLPDIFVALVVAVGIMYNAVFRIIEDDFRKQDLPLYHITLERKSHAVMDEDSGPIEEFP